MIKKTKTWKKYLEWGAKRASWYPLGVMPEDYNPSLTTKEISTRNRDIDVIYVGAPDPLKVNRLLKLKKYLKKHNIEIKIYGKGWDFLKSNVYNNFENLPEYIKGPMISLWSSKPSSNLKNSFLPDGELAPTYQRAKIGINIHESYGPCNRRLYALPANGVMQICDCPEGLGDVFEIEKEVVVYNSIEEAGERIKYYLEHNEERKKIAAAGFRRAMSGYKDTDILSRVLETIKKGMVEDGIKHFKNSEPISI